MWITTVEDRDEALSKLEDLLAEARNLAVALDLAAPALLETCHKAHCQSALTSIRSALVELGNIRQKMQAFETGPLHPDTDEPIKVGDRVWYVRWRVDELEYLRHGDVRSMTWNERRGEWELMIFPFPIPNLPEVTPASHLVPTPKD